MTGTTREEANLTPDQIVARADILFNQHRAMIEAMADGRGTFSSTLHTELMLALQEAWPHVRAPSPRASEPVAWRVKDFADSYFITQSRNEAENRAMDGHKVEPLYATPPSPSAGTIPTCCVTGAIPGDGGACGDCDPCIMGEASVPEAVKRLIAEKNSLLARIGELEDNTTALELPAIPDDDADFTPDLARKIIAKYQEMLAATPPSPSAGREEIEQAFADHYWDSFEADREIILKHIGCVLDFVFKVPPPETPDCANCETRMSNMGGGYFHCTICGYEKRPKLATLSPSRTEGGQAEGHETDWYSKLPLAVRLRDEDGPPLPQMIAQQRAKQFLPTEDGEWNGPSYPRPSAPSRTAEDPRACVSCDPENDDRLIEFNGIIVARVPDCVERKWRGISYKMAAALAARSVAVNKQEPVNPYAIEETIKPLLDDVLDKDATWNAAKPGRFSELAEKEYRTARKTLMETIISLASPSAPSPAVEREAMLSAEEIAIVGLKAEGLRDADIEQGKQYRRLWWLRALQSAEAIRAALSASATCKDHLQVQPATVMAKERSDE